jgi:hypothetical protein
MRSAAMSVVPEPRSTGSLRRVTSWMTSATSAVGVTVGCSGAAMNLTCAMVDAGQAVA